MIIPEIEKEIKLRVEMTVKLLKVVTDDFNLPDTNLFYKLLLQTPVIKERIDAKEEKR